MAALIVKAIRSRRLMPNADRQRKDFEAVYTERMTGSQWLHAASRKIWQTRKVNCANESVICAGRLLMESFMAVMGKPLLDR